ncbi:type II secretion system F family protein [Agromyces bauzanensis]
MNALFLAVAVIGAGLGILLLFVGLFPAKSTGTKPPTLISRRIEHVRNTVPRRQLLLIAAGVLGGVILWYFTGLFIVLVVVPAAVIGLPLLLAKPASANNIAKLEAIEAWTRSLGGLITAGVGLEQAITVSLTSAPDLIRPQVADLVARINARWRTEDALRKFADEMNDPTADIVTAHLILAAKIPGDGLATALTDLSEIVFEEVKHRREIESDQEKPRSTARNVTLITVIAIGVLAISGTFLDGYRSVIGQLLLTLYLLMYVGALLWLRRMSLGRPAPRILVDTRKQGA